MYDMKNKPHEVEEFAKNLVEEERKNNLRISQMAEISGIRGKQFNREIFTAVLKFKDLVDFLEVFPEVQRSLNRKKVGTIKNYVLSGLEDESAMRFFSAITVTCRGGVFYDENTHRIAIDTRESKLSCNDGQHRFFGVNEAIKELQQRADNGRDKFARSQAQTYLDILREMIIPVVIFNQISQKEESQLFHDLNDLAARPSRSATIRLNQVDLFSQMARDIAGENLFMTRYGVEMDKMSIHGSNPNLILLTTIHAGIKELLWDQYIEDKSFLNAKSYAEYKEVINETFNQIFRSFPNDVDTKGKYLIQKNYSIKGICRFIHHARTKLDVSEETIFETISTVDWTPNFTKWGLYGGTKSKRGSLLFSGGEGGIGATFDMLLDTLRFKVGTSRSLDRIKQEEATEQDAG